VSVVQNVEEENEHDIWLSQFQLKSGY